MATYTTIPALSPASAEFPLPSLQTAFSSPSSILYPPSPPTGSSPSSSIGGRSGAFATTKNVSFGDNKENSFAYSHGCVNGTTRDEQPPHEGPGTAVYVRQPTRSQLKAASVGLFGSPYKPFYYKDPSGKPFIDIDGNDCGPRWVLVDPSGGKKKVGGVNAEDAGDKGCVVM